MERPLLLSEKSCIKQRSLFIMRNVTQNQKHRDGKIIKLHEPYNYRHEKRQSSALVAPASTKIDSRFQTEILNCHTCFFFVLPRIELNRKCGKNRQIFRSNKKAAMGHSNHYKNMWLACIGSRIFNQENYRSLIFFLRVQEIKSSCVGVKTSHFSLLLCVDNPNGGQ